MPMTDCERNEAAKLTMIPKVCSIAIVPCDCQKLKASWLTDSESPGTERGRDQKADTLRRRG